MKMQQPKHLCLPFLFFVLSTALFGQTVSGTVSNTFSNGDLTITLEIGPSTTQITMESPDNVWSAIGFDAQAMNAQPYTLVYLTDSTIVERQLGNYSAGSVLPAFFAIQSVSNSNNMRTIVATRDNDISGACPTCYTFNPLEQTIEIIIAIGQSANFGYHGFGNKAPEMLATTLELSSVAVNNTGDSPDPSAILDINSSQQGVLFPRVSLGTLDNPAPIANPADGLVVYNVNNLLGEGLYIWENNAWQKLVTQSPPNQSVQSPQTTSATALSAIMERINELEQKVQSLEKENAELKAKVKEKN